MLIILAMVVIVIIVVFVLVYMFGFSAIAVGGAKNRKADRAFQSRFGKSQAQFQHDYALSHGFTEAQWAALTPAQRNRWIVEQNEMRKAAN